MRKSEIKRKTSETDISLTLNLDGTGKGGIDTGCGFLDHMLELFGRHGRFDLSVSCRGDVSVDYHHTVEDVGIVLGRAFSEALADRRGIRRYGFMLLAMDEALARVALDISGRGGFYGTLAVPAGKIGDFDGELAEEFLIGFCREAGVTLHIDTLSGKNGHHIVEAAFKGFGRAMRDAVSIDPAAKDDVPSTKGTIL